MLVVSWPFCGVATTCGVALIGGSATAQPARQTSISRPMRRAVLSRSPLTKSPTPVLPAGLLPVYDEIRAELFNCRAAGMGSILGLAPGQRPPRTVFLGPAWRVRQK